jgi:hypothetical protein
MERDRGAAAGRDAAGRPCHRMSPGFAIAFPAERWEEPSAKLAPSS